jgi:hypothetical protein
MNALCANHIEDVKGGFSILNRLSTRCCQGYGSELPPYGFENLQILTHIQECGLKKLLFKLTKYELKT